MTVWGRREAFDESSELEVDEVSVSTEVVVRVCQEALE
jgi:hypothetical protein